MTRLEKLEREIQRLGPEELATLRERRTCQAWKGESSLITPCLFAGHI